MDQLRGGYAQIEATGIPKACGDRAGASATLLGALRRCGPPVMSSSPSFDPSSRACLTWTPEMLRSAEVLADGGYLRMAADLCETMLGDDRIKTVVDQRTEALFGLDLSGCRASKRSPRIPRVGST